MLIELVAIGPALHEKVSKNRLCWNW